MDAGIIGDLMASQDDLSFIRTYTYMEDYHDVFSLTLLAAKLSKVPL